MKRNKIYILSAIIFLVVGLIFGIILTTSLNLPDKATSEETVTGGPKPLPTTENISKVIKEVMPSVVTITSTKIIRVRSPFADDFFFFFPFGESPFEVPERREQEYKEQGLGSGVIVSKDGYILTNNHVISGADEIKVRVNKNSYDAKVVGSDAKTDLAVLKIDAPDLKPAKLGDSDSLKIGEWVIAIGSPFQLEHTATLGIISAKGRSRVGIADYEDFLQTDAAINPGNSGGALVNLRGEVIGINTAIASRSGGYQGIGFAIPVNMAKQVMDMIINKGKVVRGWIGIKIQDVTPDIASALSLKEPKGIIISEVFPDSPGEKAGLKQGDVVTELDGRSFDNSSDFRNAVASKQPGTKVVLTVIRNGAEKKIEVVLGELPGEAEVASREESPEKSERKRIGIAVAPLSYSEARRLGLKGGVVVEEVEPNSPAMEAGIREGDIILEINGRRIENMDDFRTATRNLKTNNLFLIKRDIGVFYIVVKI